jgi:hypothetical protein
MLFRPARWDRWSQRLEVTVGELLSGQPVPLLKRRLELSPEEASSSGLRSACRLGRPQRLCGIRPSYQHLGAAEEE